MQYEMPTVGGDKLLLGHEIVVSLVRDWPVVPRRGEEGF